jgi:hypothetical protein
MQIKLANNVCKNRYREGCKFKRIKQKLLINLEAPDSNYKKDSAKNDKFMQGCVGDSLMTHDLSTISAWQENVQLGCHLSTSLAQKGDCFVHSFVCPIGY